MEQKDFEKMTGVSLEELLQFNEKRLERANNDPALGEYRAFVQERIANIKAQIEGQQPTK